MTCKKGCTKNTKWRFGLRLEKTRKHRASETWEQWIKQKRKVIETVFSVLVDHYRITEIRANSIIGFEVALDGILLAYSLVTLGLVER